jgi:hypothetical protein
MAEEEARKYKGPEELALEDEITGLKNQIRKHSAIVKQLASVEVSLGKLEPQRYGCRTTQELRALRVQRRDLVLRVLGDMESAAHLGFGVEDENEASEAKAYAGGIIGYIREATDEFGHDCPLPVDGDPFREWLATLRERQIAEAANNIARGLLHSRTCHCPETCGPDLPHS